MKFLSASEAKDLIRKDGTSGNLKKEYVGVAELVTPRQLRFTLSTADPDRDNDVISQDGWQLENFRQNPVVCWNHQTTDLPIGKCVSIGLVGNRLKGVVEFVPADIPEVGPLAEAVLRLCTSGFLSAVSVGFRPLAWDWLDDEHDGIAWQQQELMEWSLCTVPSNPFCLLDPPLAETPTNLAVLNNRTPNRRRLSLLLSESH